jgi:hypothetical protein
MVWLVSALPDCSIIADDHRATVRIAGATRRGKRRPTDSRQPRIAPVVPVSDEPVPAVPFAGMLLPTGRRAPPTDRATARTGRSAQYGVRGTCCRCRRHDAEPLRQTACRSRLPNQIDLDLSRWVNYRNRASLRPIRGGVGHRDQSLRSQPGTIEPTTIGCLGASRGGGAR